MVIGLRGAETIRLLLLFIYFTTIVQPYQQCLNEFLYGSTVPNRLQRKSVREISPTDLVYRMHDLAKT